MSRSSRFKLVGGGYGKDFNGKPMALVEIDRGTNIVTVRPYRMRKVYQMPLEDLARIIIYRCVTAELAEKRKLKKAKQKERRLVRRGA